MRPVHLFALSLLLACGSPPAEAPPAPEAKGETRAPPEAGDAEAAPDAEAPAAEEGAAGEAEATPGRTKADLESHADHAHGFQPWDQAYGRLVEAYGEPDLSEGDQMVWFGKDGDTCWALSVQNMGGSVGQVELKESKGCP